MATSVASITFEDFAGDRKTAALYFDDTATLADITTIMQGWASQLDDVVDPKVVSIQVALAIALPEGLKADAVDGNTVHEGALLSYSATGTARTFSVYVPGWAEAGFAGNTVVDTGDQDTAIQTVVTGIVGATADPSDAYSNDIVAYSGGKRAFRK